MAENFDLAERIARYAQHQADGGYQIYTEPIRDMLALSAADYATKVCELRSKLETDAYLWQVARELLIQFGWNWRPNCHVPDSLGRWLATLTGKNPGFEPDGVSPLTKAKHTAPTLEWGDWTTLGELRPGAIFETEKGVRAVKTEYQTFDGSQQCDCYLLESGEAARFARRNKEIVRELLLASKEKP